MHAKKRSRCRNIPGVLVIFSLLWTCAAVAAEKYPELNSTRVKKLDATVVPSPFRNMNLAIYARDMWVVVRYDAQANSMIASGSDGDGPVLWSTKKVNVAEDNVEGLTLKARTVLRLGGSSWVDWQDFTIYVDGAGNATITKANPTGTFTYKGKAIPIKTLSIDSPAPVVW
ncbi:MAG: hypothetical protein ABFD62_15005 [Syntrophaceae bacterium]